MSTNVPTMGLNAVVYIEHKNVSRRHSILELEADDVSPACWRAAIEDRTRHNETLVAEIHKDFGTSAEALDFLDKAMYRATQEAWFWLSVLDGARQASRQDPVTSDVTPDQVDADGFEPATDIPPVQPQTSAPVWVLKDEG